MEKFSGKIGYGKTVESSTQPSVYEEITEEISAIGDIIRSSRRVINSGNVIDNIEVTDTLSVIASPKLIQNFQFIKYVKYQGAKWKVTSVTPGYPRLTLTLGGVYNGE